MSPVSLRCWSALHRWSSILSSLFLAIICVTGLPLVFASDIDHWIHPPVHRDTPRQGAPQQTTVDLDRIVALGRARFPGERIVSVFRDDQAPEIRIWLRPAPDPRSHKAGPLHYLRFDAATGVPMEDVQASGQHRWSVMNVFLTMHRNLFAGLAGELFLAVIGLLLVVAVVSGVVLYQPFTKRLSFGTVRTARARRIKWLDLHNLLGISTVVWVLVVGTTGVVNELSTPLFAIWIRGDVAAILNDLKAGMPDATPPTQTELSSVQQALLTATRAAPGMTITEITFPASGGASPWHYVAWTKGTTPLTSRMFSPLLIDARTGKLAAIVQMPWYLKILEISRPLHYGDYGGLPLKLIWAVLDILTLFILGSGAYLLIARKGSRQAERPPRGGDALSNGKQT